MKCQTDDWPHHKEECPGHLRKIGMASLQKAQGFHQQQNWLQAIRHSDFALKRLKRLADCPIEVISAALCYKCDALGFLGQFKEALECTKEWYNLWAMERGPAHPNTIEAAFSLIECLIHNDEFVDAELFARTLWEILNSSTHHFEEDRIPDDQRQKYLARGAMEYARAIARLAEAGGIPSEKKKRRGEEAIALARRSLEMCTQLYGAESADVANAMAILATMLDRFDDIDDEALCLCMQSNTIYARVQGRLSINTALSEYHLGESYARRADRALTINDLDRCAANLELALPHYREAARIDTAINHMDKADDARGKATAIEEKIRQIAVTRAAKAAAVTKG